MIDWNASAELNNTTEDKLRARFVRFTQSNKLVVAICDMCGKVRNLKWQNYNDLCHKCSHGTPDARKANRERGIERFSDPAKRRDASAKAIKRFSNPSERDAARLRAIARFSDPAARKQISDAKKQYHVDNPEAGGEQSKRLVMYYKDNPGARKKMSETLKNSEARKAVTEKQVGGNDVVGHHMIYDHSDLSKNVMYMTRSMHMQLHNLFRNNGVEIPHVNTGTPHQSNSGGIHAIV